MAVEAQSTSKSPPVSGPGLPLNLPEYEARALEDLKSLCEKNELYWPVSKLEDHPTRGSNNDVDLLYVSTLEKRVSVHQKPRSRRWFPTPVPVLDVTYLR